MLVDQALNDPVVVAAPPAEQRLERVGQRVERQDANRLASMLPSACFSTTSVSRPSEARQATSAVVSGS